MDLPSSTQPGLHMNNTSVPPSQNSSDSDDSSEEFVYAYTSLSHSSSPGQQSELLTTSAAQSTEAVSTVEEVAPSDGEREREVTMETVQQEQERPPQTAASSAPSSSSESSPPHLTIKGIATASSASAESSTVVYSRWAPSPEYIPSPPRSPIRLYGRPSRASEASSPISPTSPSLNHSNSSSDSPTSSPIASSSSNTSQSIARRITALRTPPCVTPHPLPGSAPLSAKALPFSLPLHTSTQQRIIDLEEQLARTRRDAEEAHSHVRAQAEAAEQEVRKVEAELLEKSKLIEETLGEIIKLEDQEEMLRGAWEADSERWRLKVQEATEELEEETERREKVDEMLAKADEQVHLVRLEMAELQAKSSRVDQETRTLQGEIWRGQKADLEKQVFAGERERQKGRYEFDKLVKEGHATKAELKASQLVNKELKEKLATSETALAATLRDKDGLRTHLDSLQSRIKRDEAGARSYSREEMFAIRDKSQGSKSDKSEGGASNKTTSSHAARTSSRLPLPVDGRGDMVEIAQVRLDALRFDNAKLKADYEAEKSRFGEADKLLSVCSDELERLEKEANELREERGTALQLQNRERVRAPLDFTPNPSPPLPDAPPIDPASTNPSTNILIDLDPSSLPPPPTSSVLPLSPLLSDVDTIDFFSDSHSRTSNLDGRGREAGHIFDSL